jgi:hypothetical protein
MRISFSYNVPIFILPNAISDLSTARKYPDYLKTKPSTTAKLKFHQIKRFNKNQNNYPIARTNNFFPDKKEGGEFFKIDTIISSYWCDFATINRFVHIKLSATLKRSSKSAYFQFKVFTLHP